LVFSIPAWLLSRRRNSSRTKKACLLFVGLYLLYWSWVGGTLRFAIAPIVLLLLFLADRAAQIYCSSPRFTRVILACCLFYCGVFSLLVVTLLQINGPELKIFARQLDWPGYLRTWHSAYRSLEYLRTQAQPGDLVLSVDNCAAAYAPDPSRWHGLCDVRINSPDAVRAELARERYRFLVLPRGSEVNPGTPAVFEDDYFAVYRLAQ